MNAESEAAAQLMEGINLVLSQWPALRMAVEDGRGGPDSLDKPQELALLLFNLLRGKVYFEDVIETLDQFMVDSLSTEIQDCTLEEVAEKLMVMHEECLQGNFDSINKLRETSPPIVSYTRQLEEGINLVLSRWAALRMAVESERGGRDSLKKSQQLALVLFNLLFNLLRGKGKVYSNDVIETLDHFMVGSMSTEIQDSSLEEVAEKLMVMREECLQGNFDSINKLRETSPPIVSYAIQSNGDDEEDSEEEDEDDFFNALIETMLGDTPQCHQPNFD